MTTIPEELLEQIPTWDFEQMYEHFDLLEPTKNVKNRVEKGIRIKFPVQIIIEELYEEFPNHKKIRVKGMGMINYFSFKEEVRARKKEMMKYIYEHWNNDVTEGRIEIRQEKENES